MHINLIAYVSGLWEQKAKPINVFLMIVLATGRNDQAATGWYISALAHHTSIIQYFIGPNGAWNFPPQHSTIQMRRVLCRRGCDIHQLACPPDLHGVQLLQL